MRIALLATTLLAAPALATETTHVSISETVGVDDSSEAETPDEAPEVDPFTQPSVDFDAVVTPQSPHFDLEVLYNKSEFAEGLEIAKARLAENPQDIELYIQIVRFMFELGETIERTDPTMDKKTWYTEMIDVAEKGLEIDPNNIHLLYGYGIGKARLGTTRGVLSSLFMAKEIEEVWLRVAQSDYRYSSLGGQEMLPCDAELTLGIFYRLVPDWWIVKVLAGTRGDLDKSHERLLAADACYPDRVGVVKELGVTELCIGTKRKGDEAMLAAGRATLERMLALPAETPSDVIDQRHARMLLEDPELACEYSRDGQQELDEEKMEKVE